MTMCLTAEPAELRFQESTNRLTLKFTAPEGAPGKVTVYIIPALPPKTCPTIEVQLLPLCLHQLVSSPGSVLRQQGSGAGLQGDEGAAVLFSQLQLERPFSELVFQGGWLVTHLRCVRGMPHVSHRTCVHTEAPWGVMATARAGK